MEIKVTFKFDASDSFLAAAGKFYEAAQAIACSGMLSTLPDKDRGVVKAVATSEGVTVNKKERIYPPEKEAEGVTADVATEAPVESESTETVEKPRKCTVEDVREAMRQARQRIEGDDYLTNTGSEGYKKYHKALTSKFKNISNLYGADKPSELAADKRQMFIDECSHLHIGDDGEITSDLPF